MAASGDAYERELKALLSGDRKAVAKMVKTCDDRETEGYRRVLESPFLMTRAAGSLGVDLIALRWDMSFPIEVKSSSEDVFHFSKSDRLMEQAQGMLMECGRAHLLPIYAYRLKAVRGDPWRLFTIPSDDDWVKMHNFMYKRLPKFDVTSNGNFVMRWESGMKLSEFLNMLNGDEDEN